MSGDAGGGIAAIAALAVVVAAAPYILTAAAVGAAGYAAVKAGGMIAKKIQEENRIKEVEVNNCSKQLGDMYADINRAIRNANELQRQHDLKTQETMKAVDEAIKKIDLDSGNAEQWGKELDAQKAKFQKSISFTTGETKKQISESFKRAAEESISTYEKIRESEKALVEWKNEAATQKAKKQALAVVSLKDAKATMAMLSSLEANSKNIELKQKVDVLKASMESIEYCFENQLYEATLSSANTLVTQGAILASEFALDEYEHTQAYFELEMKLETLFKELEMMRYHKITSKGQEEISIDLNDFSQGMYFKAMEEIKGKLDELSRHGSEKTVTELMNGISECDLVADENGRLISVAKIIDVSKEKMFEHYEKCAVMDIVADFMCSQGYDIEWACNVSDDMTQKLVINFSNPVTKNTVSVAIDTDGRIDDFCNYVMELASFYATDCPVSEAEKAKLREGINKKLRENGIHGGLSCNDNYGAPSTKKHLETEENVISSKPVSIYS